MEWLKWLIPLVAVAVWILSQLVANQQRRQQGLPRSGPPRDPGDETPPRRPSDDLEKFLEEVRRRKEAQESAAAEPIYSAQEIPARPAHVPRATEGRRKSVAVGSKPQQRRVEPAVVVQPLPSASSPKSRHVAMPSTAPPAAPEAPQALPPPPVVPTAPQAVHRPESLPARTPASPAAKMVRELLKNRQSLGAAFLLREILDRPLCKRRR